MGGSSCTHESDEEFLQNFSLTFEMSSRFFPSESISFRLNLANFR
jgi:hypothetical protein